MRNEEITEKDSDEKLELKIIFMLACIQFCFIVTKHYGKVLSTTTDMKLPRSVLLTVTALPELGLLLPESQKLKLAPAVKEEVELGISRTYLPRRKAEMFSRRYTLLN